MARAKRELEELLSRQLIDADAAEHVRATVEAMPDLLRSMERAVSRPDAPGHAQRVFRAVMLYLLDEDDLIPSHAGQPLYGLLDDVYLLHRAAVELAPHLEGLDGRSVAGGMQLLESILPRGVTGELGDKVREAVEEGA